MKSKIHVVWNYCVLCIVVVKGNFIKRPDDVTECSGVDLTFGWEYSGSANVVMWEKLPSTTVLSHVLIVDLLTPGSGYEGRIRHNSNGNMTLKSLKEEDSGTYKCTVTYLLGIAEDSIDVIIYNRLRMPPSITYNSKTNKLSCTVADVNSGIHYTWTLNEEVIGTENALIPKNSGVYTCVITGKAIEMCAVSNIKKNASFSLQMEKPVVAARQPTIRTIDGQSVTLECYVVSAVPQIINSWKWFRENEKGNILSYSPTYNISFVTVGHGLNYKCTASNDAGESIPVTVMVQVLTPPHIQSFGEYSPLENSNLHIRCNISSNPSPNWDQVHWTKIESISFRVSGFSLYFNEISRQEAGIYTCHVTTLLELTSGQILTKTDNKNVTIDVLYAPGSSIKLSTTSNSIITIENSAIPTVLCSANCNPGCAFNWQTPSGTLIAGAELSLGNAKRNMNGTYTCSASTSIGLDNHVAYARIDLIIHYSPFITSILPSKSVSVMEESQITLVCKAGGYPSPNITWSYMGKNDTSSLKSIVDFESLTFVNISRMKGGIYFCHVNNGIGEGHFEEIHLTVTHGPGLSVEILPLNSISVSENETIENITCSATCNPVCSYKWQKPDGNHVADNNLELGAAHRDMSGTYLCTAENEIQSMTLQGFARLSLLVYYSATISFFSPKNKLILEEGDTLQIVCEADGYPFPNITWSKNNNIFSRKDVHYFKALSCGDSGYYTCIVTNGIGSTDEDGFNLSIPCGHIQEDTTTVTFENGTGGSSINLSQINSDSRQSIFIYVGIGGGIFVVVAIAVSFIIVYTIKGQRQIKGPINQQATDIQPGNEYNEILDTDVSSISPSQGVYSEITEDGNTVEEPHSTDDPREPSGGKIAYFITCNNLDSSYLCAVPSNSTVTSITCNNFESFTRNES
ncbi:hemicentin-1-like isoform X4 [Mytilus edulis]|uniref:hemicentin-1-like isoform X4 n=1 Tax=Mytilus edulis TaxID=6550 RepID=UPI0039EFEA52